jgi:hypothetical protein
MLSLCVSKDTTQDKLPSDPQPNKRLKASEEFSLPSEIEACCMWHRVLLTEDFDSEEDAQDLAKPPQPGTVLTFLSECPPEVEHELFRLVTSDEKSTQTSMCDPTPLSTAASFIVFGTKASLAEITPSPRKPGLQHRIKLSVKGPISPLSRSTESYFGTRCHICSRVFKSHQALGGHMSRKHR